MLLWRNISDKNRVSIPQDVMNQMNLKVGDSICIDVKTVDGKPTMIITRGVDNVIIGG